MNDIPWSLTIPIMVVILGVIFQKPLSKKIQEIRKFKKEDKNYEVIFEGSEIPIEDHEVDTSLIDEIYIVSSLLDHFPSFNKTDVTRLAPILRAQLSRFQILRKDQLDSLLDDDEAISFTRKLYRTELLRGKGKEVLDPIAIATWTAALHRFGNSDDIKNEVRKQIQMSPEYFERRGEVVNQERLDNLVRKYTSFDNYEELLNAKSGYRPTIPISLYPELKILADSYDQDQEARGDSRKAFRS